MHGFYMDSGDLNSGPHAYSASILSIKPSIQILTLKQQQKQQQKPKETLKTKTEH